MSTHTTYLALFMLVLMAPGGCGGGGGGGMNRPDPPPEESTVGENSIEQGPASDEFNMQVETLAASYRQDASFLNQWGLLSINADRAYAHIDIATGTAPGTGITIGFIDTGIDQGHPLFEDNTINEEFLFSATDETGARFSHGTAVASVAAASRQPEYIRAAHGVAWGADIAMFAIPLGSGGGNYRPTSTQALGNSDADFANLFNHALNWRDGQRTLDILNLSFGASGIIDNYNEQSLRTSFRQTIAALVQADADNKAILVWAAGNAHGDPCDDTDASWCEDEDGDGRGTVNAVSVELMPGLAARIPELRAHTLAVVAVAADGTIADFSNRCGIAADYCLAAPGEDIVVAYFGRKSSNCSADCDGGRGTAVSRGTSYAAPMVSGSLALMKQLFRDQLSNTQLAARLLLTANKSGIYSDQSTYGQGLLDIGAATAPVGMTTVTLGDRVTDPGVELYKTRIELGRAFGDALQHSLAGQEIVTFDSLGAPFWFKLDKITTTAQTPTASARLHRFLRPAATGAKYRSAQLQIGPVRHLIHSTDSPATLSSENLVGHLALVEQAPGLSIGDTNNIAITAFTTEGTSAQQPATGAALAWKPTGSSFSLHAGWLAEQRSLLGSTADGAFGTLSGNTVFTGIQANTMLGHWRLGADAELGTVTPATRSGMITDTTELLTSSFSLRANRAVADGVLHLSLTQPLRIENGRASLMVPAGRTKAGGVIRQPVLADLTPDGRQIDIAAEWHRQLPSGELRLGAIWSHEPGHRATAAPEMTLLTGWRLKFK